MGLCNIPPRQFGASAHGDVCYESIAWRNVRPLFVDRPFTVWGKPAADGKSAKLWVMMDDNALALSMQARFH